MAALTADRNTVRRTGEAFSRPVAAGVLIYEGALVCINGQGYAVPGAIQSARTADGRAQARADNTLGATGAINVWVHPGIFRWDNSAGADQITASNIGATCYVVDDHTVALTNDGGGPACGRIVDVDTVGVWVATGQVFGV